jgi:hypothetical protein
VGKFFLAPSREGHVEAVPSVLVANLDHGRSRRTGERSKRGASAGDRGGITEVLILANYGLEITE